MRYQVICGNIGSVRETNEYKDALEVYALYIGHSKSKYGRAAGESVTLCDNGEPIKEYIGAIDRAVSDQFEE
jgi:hypothetical protein